ncbi:hypothetical protein ACHQM5_014562 [Ranunculus cassubicifolius]
MWRSYKQELYQGYVKDKNPRIARENPPSSYTHPLEEWQLFVDNCNTPEFKESSERNTKNREKQTMPSCSGRRLASVVRHNIASERGVPDSEVGRSEAYIVLHTRQDKSLQCSELVDALKTYMTVHPESRATAVDDALMQTTHADKRGFRGMGTGISKTQIRMGEPMRKKAARLLEKNTELENTINNMHVQFQQQMDELRSLIMRQAGASTSNNASPHAHASCHGVEVDTSSIGRECYLRAGWPMRNVAKGIVQDVNPLSELGGIQLGEDNCKVYVIAVMEPNILLPCPHDEYTMTLGQLGQGSVIWPKVALPF